MRIQKEKQDPNGPKLTLKECAASYKELDEEVLRKLKDEYEKGMIYYQANKIDLPPKEKPKKNQKKMIIDKKDKRSKKEESSDDEPQNVIIRSNSIEK